MKPRQNLSIKWGRREKAAGTLWGLRTFQSARGGEVTGVLPGPATRFAPWTRLLVYRGLPFAGVALALALQALAGTGPVVVFPLYLAVVMLSAYRLTRLVWAAVAAIAAVAIAAGPVIAGRSTDVTAALLLAAVLLGVAIVVGELTRQWREAASRSGRIIESLNAEDQRLEAVVEAASVGLGLAEMDGAWVRVNDRLASIAGRSREEMVATGLPEVVVERDRSALASALAMLRVGDVARWDAETVFGRPDGTEVWVALYLARTASTASPMLLVQATDISARIRSDAIRDCAAAVRHVISGSLSWEQSMPQLLEAIAGHLGWSAAIHWTADTDHSLLRAREAWSSPGALIEAFVEASRRMAIPAGSGLTGRAWQGGVIAAEQEVLPGIQPERHEVARNAGLRSALAFPLLDAGAVIGVIELVATTVRPVDDAEVTMLAGLGVEIGQFIRRSEVAQALRRSEADHRAIYERSPIGIARIGSEGDLLEANPALLKMLEHDEATMQGSAWADLLRAYDQAAARNHQAPLLAGISDGGSVQIRAATGGGRWLWLQMTATSIPDSNGRLEHVLVLVEDVTTVRETSDKLAEALEAQRDANINLEKLDRTKSEFLSIVSHEFRTALTGIQGFSELIRDGGLEPDEVRAYGAYIFNDADRVNRLIGDMLDLDRMESGRMSMRTGNVDINEVLTEAIARVVPGAITVDFKADLDPRLPVVAGDRDRLIQVVSNLVNNAVKYSPEGGTVTLSSRAEEGFALISVTDSGIGIPADEIGHVFERFRRVRSGAAQSIPGTGLGLTIVKQIVEMHGGKIWVESAVGLGSSFHFTIPLAAEPAVPLQLRHG